MTRNLGVGVIGCGNISTTYFSLAPLFKGIEMRACADINPDVAKARADEHGVRAASVEELLAADDVDIVLNLTIPAAHYAVSRAALEAGKHVYSEKPFVLTTQEGLALRALADDKGLRIGSAPDTFLGGSHQLARRLIDDGSMGRITSGTCHVLSHGMEHWHPNPDFFFQPGGGPILDLGPYYIANLINMIGPVKKVAALATIPAPERTITSKPRHGEKIAVSTPTTIHALMEFANGAAITFNASWDVWAHGHAPMELYGEEGSLFLPDPNFFGGDLRTTKRSDPVEKHPDWDHPFGVANQKHGDGAMANYRTAGLADMALAIIEQRPHRCSMELALHTIEVMTGILKSGELGAFVAMETTCERPAALGPDEARALLENPQAIAA
jgi:predicted dehydrogenase